MGIFKFHSFESMLKEPTQSHTIFIVLKTAFHKQFEMLKPIPRCPYLSLSWAFISTDIFKEKVLKDPWC